LKLWLKKFYDIYVRRDGNARAFYQYQEAGGESLRLDYQLDKDSIVLDAGGYIGDFANDIHKRFKCEVDVFEPVNEYFEQIQKRFDGNTSIKIIQAGLGAAERTERICKQGLGSSTYSATYNHHDFESIKIIPVLDYIRSRNNGNIDLIKINIEGGEYDLLNSILETPDDIEKIRYLQIQFHDFVPNAEKLRENIRHKMSATHEIMWDFPFIWESWRLKSDSDR